MAMTAPGIRPASMSAFSVAPIRASRSLERPTSSGLARGRGIFRERGAGSEQAKRGRENFDGSHGRLPFGLFGPLMLFAR
jgi:hypothetical protein